MIELGIGFVIAVFVAGMLTFLAPCTLPLVPAFLGFISGASLGEGGKIDSSTRKRIIVNTIFYILGFSLVFMVFGVLAGIAGAYLAPTRTILTKVGGAIVIFFGLYLMGVFKIGFLAKDGRSKLTSKIKKRGPLASFSFGAAFGAGWSPCVGPIVGSVLLLASTEGSIGVGVGLLGVFSLGLGIPFLLTGIFISRATVVLQKIEKYLLWINRGAGLLIIALGILLITNNLDFLIAWGFRALSFFNYEDLLLNYL